MVSSDPLTRLLTGLEFQQFCGLPQPIQLRLRHGIKGKPPQECKRIVKTFLTLLNTPGDKETECVSPPPPPVPVKKRSPPKKRRKSVSFLPKKAPVCLEPEFCTNQACDWANDHRPRHLEDIVGNRTAKDKLKTWMQQRKDLVQYINARRPVRLPRYRESLRGETSGDGVFDGVRIPSVALLHGPPGVGKTTLAIAFMKHYGLSYEEVNASDVNTGNRLLSVVSATVHVAGTGLIMDEFDGVFGGEEASGGVTDLLRALDKLTVFDGPVIVIVNDVTAPHVKTLRSSAVCLDVRLFPIDSSNAKSVLQGMLRKHTKRLSTDIQRALVDDCRGDVRILLHSAQFHSRCTGSTVCTVSNEAQVNQLFAAAHGLLTGRINIRHTSLYSEPRLAAALAFHNYLPAVSKSRCSLDEMALHADALSHFDMNCRQHWQHIGSHMSVMAQHYAAHPLANVTDTYASKVKPNEHNIQWPHATLVKPVVAPPHCPAWVDHLPDVPTLPRGPHDLYYWRKLVTEEYKAMYPNPPVSDWIHGLLLDGQD